MKVLIVGGGIGGLTLGAFLKNSNIEFDIIEKCSDWKHQGFVIGLWDNGRDILNKLNLAERLDREGSRVQKHSVRNGKGDVLRNYNFSGFFSEFGGAITIIGRKELHNMLLERLDASKISMGSSVHSLKQNKSGVTVNFADGRTKEYDVVVGADGVHSTVRELVFGGDVESFTNWRAWYVWINNAYNVPATIVTYLEPRASVMTLATGGRTMALMVAPADHTKWDTQEGRIKRLKELFKNETHIVPAALEELSDEDALPTDIVEVNMRHFVKERVVLIGDAAHCSGPTAGLGTSMALEDAYTLAGELMKVSSDYSLYKALSTYEKSRKKRTTVARRLTRRARIASLVKSPFLMKIIDVLAPFIPERFLANGYRQLLKNEI